MSKASDFKFRFFCVLLAFFVIASFVGINRASLTAEAVMDQPSSWAAAEVESARIAGLIPMSLILGHRDNTTRIEFCHLVMNMIQIKSGKSIPDYLNLRGLVIDAGVFTDTSDGMILAANALGIVNGIGGGLFNPSGTLQRQQAAAMLARAATVLGFDQPNDQAMVFADGGNFDSYAVGPINFISACSDRTSMRRVMGGVGENRFDPKASYTKEQAILTMLRLYNAFDYEIVSQVLYIDAIEGSLMQGNTLTAGTVEYDITPEIDPVLQWQWLRSDTVDGVYQKIPGANSRQYKTTADDVDKYINVSVTASGSATGVGISTPVLIEPFQLILMPFRPVVGFYPVLTDGTPTSPFAGGKGTESEPYLIANTEQFLLLKDKTIDTYFKLSNDITLPLNETIKGKFYGHLDGAGKKITMSSNNGQGIFNEIVSGATIKNLIVAGGMTGSGLRSKSIGRLTNLNYGNITRCGSEMSSMLFTKGINLRVGALVGRNFGIVSECYSTGIIRLELEAREAINGYYPSLMDNLLTDWNRGWVGGLVGINMSGGSVRNSYSHVTVVIEAPGELSYGKSGGLISVNEGNVINCYSIGSVSKNKYKGGLIGQRTTHAVIQSSYFDKNTSGLSDNYSKGIPKTTAEMKNQATYVGWSADIWQFSSDNTQYPELKWK
ncbi:MAG: GLUG motif-containing protein [Eubacteriales bacterium]|nr:GLUG motif-containing protein [Eubacteriales bacterium]